MKMEYSKLFHYYSDLANKFNIFRIRCTLSPSNRSTTVFSHNKHLYFVRQTLKQLELQLKDCLLPEQFRLRQRLKREQKSSTPKTFTKLQQDIARSIRTRQARLQHLPKPEYPENLPVSERREEIIAAISDHQVIIICGETGSGKTTQLPKMCLDLGLGVNGYIGHTQPRRLAAQSVAKRIAEELKSEQAAGYKIRFHDKTHANTYIKVMTDGILLAEIQEDRFLTQYDTLIIDEAHERSLNIDFLLGYLKWLLPRRKDLKLIITSATIDPEKFSTHFNDAPIIEVSGRTYPVEIRYRPLVSETEDRDDRDMFQGIVDAVDELKRESRGDILIFFSGEREIRDAADILRKQNYTATEILPLFARLSSQEQYRIFQAHREQRIILSTNVAETSLTVPGIKYVIDTGQVRISRYSWRARIQRLPIERTSQASANQRSGRCGRTSDGIAIRLYSEADFLARPAFTDPEILRTNLASVILQMTHMRLGDIAAFPFIEPPDSRQIKDGFKLLYEIQAVDKQHRLSNMGRHIARIPIDPRLARMLIEATTLKSLESVLIIVSALSIQDPRERPLEKQQAADEKHSRFKDKHSDFIGYINLWNYFQEQRAALSQNKLRKLCKKEFISYIRMREWQDIRDQIARQLDTPQTESWKVNEDAIHKSLLTGLLGNIGFKDEDRLYLGAHQKKFTLFPGSVLHKKPPKWILAAELVETSKLFARTVARIQPEWIEHSAKHLIKRHYSEPHWEKRSAQVGAYERITLYGITIHARRKINYGPIDPKTSRELFIRHALIYGEYQTNAKFFQHNRKLIRSIENLEAKSRRRDILVDEEVLYDFYDRIIPDTIYNGKTFEKWRKVQEKQHADALFYKAEDLFQRDTKHIGSTAFPDKLSYGGVNLPLQYHFEPGHEHDGITCRIPHILLSPIQPALFEYLVPGMLEEKITAIIRALPKQTRKQFVPAPEYAKACVETINRSDTTPLLSALNHQLLRMTGSTISQEEWDSLTLPDHLTMRFDIIDEKGNTLKTGRDLVKLKGDVKHKTVESFQKIKTHSLEQQGLTDWSFDDLPEYITVNNHGIHVRAYPAIVAKKDAVDIQLFDNPVNSQMAHKKGLRKLFQLQTTEQLRQLKKYISQQQKLCLWYSATGKCDELQRALIEASYDHTFLGDALPRTKSDFQKSLSKHQHNLLETGKTLCHLLDPVLASHFEIHKQLKGNIKVNWLEALNDMHEQMQHLIYPGFLASLDMEQLRILPKYLKGVLRRLEKLKESESRDRGLRLQILPLWERYTMEIKKGTATQKLSKKDLATYRWMVEEFRISLFAQELGTQYRVSAKRLNTFWQEHSM